jgi:hypothetical protein
VKVAWTTLALLQASQPLTQLIAPGISFPVQTLKDPGLTTRPVVKIDLTNVVKRYLAKFTADLLLQSLKTLLHKSVEMD